MFSNRVLLKAAREENAKLVEENKKLRELLREFAYAPAPGFDDERLEYAEIQVSKHLIAEAKGVSV